MLEAENPQEYLSDLNTRVVRDLADAEPGAFRLNSRAYDLATDGSYKIEKADDFAELYVHSKLERKLGDEYDVYTQVDVDWTDRPSKEVDHLIVRNGRVVGVAETKNSVSSGALDEAEGQLGQIKRDLRTSGVDTLNTKQGSYDVPGDLEMSSNTLEPDLLYTIGGSSRFDIENLNPDVMNEIGQAVIHE